MPQGLPSTSALSRHAIYQSCYLRSGAHAGAATPIAPPGRWPRITGRNGRARRLRLSVSRLRVSVPARCGVPWTTRKCRRYCIHLMSPSTHDTNTDSVVSRMGSVAATPALARRLAQSNKDLGSRCCAARHASDRRSHPRTVPCSPLEGSAALHARRLRLSHDSSPLATSPREMWARAVLGTRVYSPTLTQARR